MQIHFKFAYFSFFPYSFGIETINTFILSRSSLENHTQFQTKMGQDSVYPFQIKTVQKPYPMGAAHTYMAYKREYPTAPSPPPPGLKHSAVSITIHICNNKSSVYVQYIIRSLTTKGSGKNVQEFQVSCIKSSDGTMEMKSFCFTVFNITLFVF